MWSPILVLSALCACAWGHGRVLEPPSRASAWRFGFPTPADYDDDGANCGGYAMQHASNGGKCGICGDAYNIPPPRPHELGGLYGVGIIVAHYLPGSSISTTVDLTTSHRGFWEFKLCPDPQSTDQACFDRHVLELEDGSTKYYPNRGSTKYNVTYHLPSGVVCDHCVLQWRYTAGNNWGDCKNGTSGLGCGPQEQFGACSDISIGESKNMRYNNMRENNEIPYPLFYYLKNGYFDAQQGILHLLRGSVQPNHRPYTQEANQQLSQHQHQTPKPPQATQLQTQTPKQQPQPTQYQLQPNKQQLQTSKQLQSNKQQLQTSKQLQSNKQQLQFQSSKPPLQSTQQTSKQQLQSAQYQLQPNKQSQQLNKHQLQTLKQQLQPNQIQIQSPKQFVQSSQHQQSNRHSQPSNIQQLQSNKQQLLTSKQQLQSNKHHLQAVNGLQSPNSQILSSHRQIKTPQHQSNKQQLQKQPYLQTPERPRAEINHERPIRKKKKSLKSARFKKHNNKRKQKSKGKPRKRKKKMPYDEYHRVIRVGTW